MAAVALAVAGMGCGASGGGGRVIDWNLSTSHTAADAGWPAGDSDGRQIDSVESLRIRLPGDLVIDEKDDIEQVLLDRDGDLLVDVVVYFPAETAERAVDRARGMARRYGLDDKGAFDQFLADVRALRAEKVEEGSGPSAGAGFPDDRDPAPGEPTLEVRVLPGSDPDPDQRWYVQLRVDWASGEAYRWDLSRSHTVADVGGGFPPDGSAEAYVPNIGDLRITLPRNREFSVERRAGEVRLSRSGDVITKLHAAFGEASPQEAHRRALELADQWGAAATALDGWFAATTAAAGPDKEAVSPALVAGEPAEGDGPQVAVGLRYERRFSGPGEYPWVVDFVLSWR